MSIPISCPGLVWSVGLAVLAALASTCNPAFAQTREWSWMSGRATANQNGVYGSKGVPDPANVPGARYTAVTWTGKDGKLWLFGGEGNSPAVGVSSIHFDDLWEFDPTTSKWTWISGSDAGGGGTYGTLGVAAPANLPGSRAGAVGWTDPSGNLWLFSGWGYDSIGQFGTLNDLWKFDIQSLQWTWMGGANTLPDNNDSCQPGTFGTRGVSAVGNVPSGRYLAVGWTDPAGDFWLFGGGSCDSNGNQGLANDLWRYSPSFNQWTWIGGGNPIYQPGVYGTVGVASAANVPGSRWFPTAWTDPAGKFWLFGGNGADAAGIRGYLNDLWEFDPSTQDWTWISGSTSIGSDNCYQTGIECAAPSVYGTLGQAAPDNVPGGRNGTAGSIDSSGNLWLFGGENEANGQINFLNDLWLFNIHTNQWAWMGGSNATTCAARDSQAQCVIDGNAGVYGTLRVAAAANVPGSRDGHMSWTDASGNFWLFGGDGVDGSGSVGILNDLWEYQTAQSPPPSFTFAAAPTSLNLQSGAQGTVTLTITPENGFNSAVSFACSGLPSGASCAFSPTTVTPSGAAATTTLTISAQTLVAAHRAEPSSYIPETVLALAFGIFRWRKRHGMHRALLLGIAVLAASCLTACGGGSERNPACPAVIPAPITSTVTVTATSGTIQQSVTMTLVVNYKSACN